MYLLTLSDDGGVPVHFRVESGNTVDDQTHPSIWELVGPLAGRRDFLYVADFKLAISENMAYVHQRQGRFVTGLPRTRREDAAFHALVRQGQVAWCSLWTKSDNEGNVTDRFSTSDQFAQPAEGYRLLWYHSQRKAEQDAVTRCDRMERGLKQLTALGEKRGAMRVTFSHPASRLSPTRHRTP